MNADSRAGRYACKQTDRGRKAGRNPTVRRTIDPRVELHAQNGTAGCKLQLYHRNTASAMAEVNTLDRQV